MDDYWIKSVFGLHHLKGREKKCFQKKHFLGEYVRSTWVFRGEKKEEKSSTQIRVFSFLTAFVRRRQKCLVWLLSKHLCVCEDAETDTGYYIYQKILHHANVAFQCRTSVQNDRSKCCQNKIFFFPQNKTWPKAAMDAVHAWILHWYGFFVLKRWPQISQRY